MATNKQDIFALNRSALAKATIKADENLIEGYVVIEKGPLLDYRNYLIDDETMAEIVELGNASTNGIKVRWTHPDSYQDHLGKYLGRAKNFRRDGNVVRADMHFSDAASKSPAFASDPIAYLMALAADDPTAFATSIYFKRDHKKMAALIDALIDSDQPIPMRIAELYASDVVDEGAAASSFFSKENHSVPQCGEGETETVKEQEMAEEAKKLEEAQALAVEEAKQADATRLEELKAEFKDSPEFVLEQYSKGNDLTQAKAEWADVLQDRLAKSEKEVEELKAKTPETKEEDGEEPVGFSGEKDTGSKAEQFERLAEEIAKEQGISVGEAYAIASTKRPDLAVV